MRSRAREAWARTRILVWPQRYVLVSLPVSRAIEVATLFGDLEEGFSAVVVEREELSLTLPEERWQSSGLEPLGASSAGPYRVVTLDNQLDLDLCGFLAPAAVRLAEAGVPVVPQCSYRTDHLLVREEDLPAALAVLEQLAGSSSAEG